MPAGVYSHRFHNHSVGATTWVYTVPAGHRAIVNYASVTSYQTPPSSAGVSLNGVPLWLSVFQVAGDTRQSDMRAVAYAGDLIQLYLSHAAMYGHVAGYLFVDPDGPPAAAGTLPVEDTDFPVPPQMQGRDA